MSKIKIEIGHTNESYRDGDKFIQYKNYNPFNHKINYKILDNLSFVPKLLETHTRKNIWEYIDGIIPLHSADYVTKCAWIFKELHNSHLTFPSFNHRRRIQHYRRIIHEKNLKIPVIDEYYKKVNRIMTKMDKTTPTHSDPFFHNFLEDTNGKIWLVDWEYATMGDKHFDLAYFIESHELTEDLEDIFLDTYKDYDYVKLMNQKILINYYVIAWVNAQKIKFFDDKKFWARIREVEQILKTYKEKWRL